MAPSRTGARRTDCRGSVGRSCFRFEPPSVDVVIRKPAREHGTVRKVLLTISVVPGQFAVCRLGAQATVPAWGTLGPFFSVTRTADELSVVCLEQNVPAEVKREPGWRLFKLEGPFDFGL